MRHTALLLNSLLATLIVFPAAADDWPQWRGPKRDGVSAETGLAPEWGSNGPPVLWMARGLGVGYSSVSVVGNRIYTMGDAGEFSFVHALDASDKGKIVWSTRIGKPGGDHPGTRSTPTVDGDRVYALGQWGDLVCLETKEGKEVWRKHLKQDLDGDMMSDWGYSESVLVDGDNVICTPGGKHGTLAALNKKTGEVVWRSKGAEDRAAYSSVIAVEIGGVRQYIQVTDKSVLGVAAADGNVLWRAIRRGSTAVVPTPIYKDDHVFVTSGYHVGCNLFRISSDGGKFNAFQVYANKDLDNHHGGVVLIGDYLYGYSDSKGWVCMEFKTGKVVWNTRGVGKGSVTAADGKLICRSEGERRGPGKSSAIALVQASPDAYNELSRFEQPERSLKEAWSHPVAAGGRLYIRDMDGLLCYDIRKK
jgi:outer membrane protein assembly factor BamB